MSKKNKDKQTRAETGQMQFGDDWPGVFIRGDNALYYAMQLETALNAPELLSKDGGDAILYTALESLANLLANANAFAGLQDVQLMKEYKNATTRSRK